MEWMEFCLERTRRDTGMSTSRFGVGEKPKRISLRLGFLSAYRQIDASFPGLSLGVLANVR
jgi:hypothetical protein